MVGARRRTGGGAAGLGRVPVVEQRCRTGRCVHQARRRPAGGPGHRAEASARRAGVLIVLPLGLCFLPAFILAGLVPVIVAVLGDVL